ncbi:MAG TPA: Na+/H+ antiporter NhaA [Prolixibacteraceae bacterium]|jgi:NhaA family Na+:H+ antiporter|nr:Na+/H+ antiporter NhaA [Bacteroidales bacterium]HPJ79336.1 Na+/H+ antiporter NhaA [Prolixibacteraceae bacterium]HRV88000.1 Na+/H+ antiporter NhaA [Prolixibacteraceae bacterium]
MTNVLKPQKVSSRIIEMLQSDALGGILLMVFTVIALIWANSPFRESYHHLWHIPLGLEIGSFKFEIHLLHFINDALMAIFFYMVGLEIKREFVAGELSSGKKAALPALGALGGMMFPALIYLAVVSLQAADGTFKGWGIPMATDIAFSLGIISLLGKRIPLALKVFLVALAIVDDLGAILVIAIFYTSEINIAYLLIGLGLLGLLFILERLNFRTILIFHLVGVVIWYFFYESGVHATIAGVLLALVTPMRRELGLRTFLKKIRNLECDEIHDDGEGLLTARQNAKVQMIKKQIKKLESPLQRLEHDLHVSVNYVIMPVFALANAGVTFGGGSGGFTSVTLAVALGLMLGKPLGITLVAWLGTKAGWAELPPGLSWKNIFGVALLGGIGFTMAIFVATLAFADEALLNQAKLGIFLGSILAGLTGFFILRKMFPEK